MLNRFDETMAQIPLSGYYDDEYGYEDDLDDTGYDYGGANIIRPGHGNDRLKIVDAKPGQFYNDFSRGMLTEDDMAPVDLSKVQVQRTK